MDRTRALRVAPLLFLLALSNDPELLQELVDAVLDAHQLEEARADA